LHAKNVRFDKAINNLEHVYEGILKKNTPTMKDATKSARFIVTAYVNTLELYLLAICLTAIVIATDSFKLHSVDYGNLRPVMIAVSVVSAVVISIFVGAITLPVHIKPGINYPIIVILNIGLSAFFVSITQPIIAALFYGEGVLTFEELIGPLLVIFGIAEIVLFVRLERFVSFDKYKLRQFEPSLNNLLPAHKRGELISLSSQDHYVEVVTTNGTHLVRLSMKEAMALTCPESGMKVHRSHWVAFAAMRACKKTAERHTVALTNGNRIPVSKANSETVERSINLRQLNK